MEITLIEGDITRQQVDAIVNAANSSLLGGGGVDGAIHRAGGPEILEECRALRAGHYGKGLPTGQAVATTGGLLAARWVIHTVGPVYPQPHDAAAELTRRTELLASCYRESLRIATELGARSVALPAVSTGVYGWPMESAARIALSETLELGRTGGLGEAIDEARFVLFGADAYGVFERVLQELSHGPMVD